MATAVRSATKLGLDPEQIEATLQPVERATMLPPAAFVEPSVLEWEIENVFGGWVCMGHVSSVSEPGAYLMREIGAEQRLRDRRRATASRAPSSTSAAIAARG